MPSKNIGAIVKDGNRECHRRMGRVEMSKRYDCRDPQERIAGIEEEKGFQALAQSKKKGAAGAKEQAEGRALQEKIRVLVRRASEFTGQGPGRVRAR